MVIVFKVRKPGPTELTWEEKNSADYRYYPEDDSKLRDFVNKNLNQKGNKKRLTDIQKRK